MADDGEPERPPPERMRIVASLQGTAVALVQPNIVAVLELPNLDPVTELAIPGELDELDVGYVDSSGRLAVLSRGAKTSTLHVVDPVGPAKLGEVEYRGAATIEGIAGDHVLVATADGLSVVDVTAEKLVAHPLPVRGRFTVAGRCGPDRFVLAVGGVLEEWDPARRAPGRRLRLDQALDPVFVGGNEQQVWAIPRKQPDAIDVISLAQRSTRRIALPEPVAAVAAHPSGFLLAVIGETSRNAFIVDLTRSKSIARVDGGAMTDVAWLGHTPTLVIKPIGAPLELVTIASGEAATPAVMRERPSTPPLAETDAEELVVQSAPPTPEVPPTQWSREDISHRLAAWRAKHENQTSWSAEAIASIAASAPGPLPAPAPAAERAGGWRAELALWARAATSRRTRPSADGLDAIAARLELSDVVRHAIALLYGAYLGGVRVAPVDLADALGWDWNEALGTGALAASDLVRWRDRDVRLCRELVAALDERPPLHGTIAPGRTSLETVAIVAPAEIDPVRVGAWAAPTIGALLVPHERGRKRGRAFVREARIRGLTPLVPWNDFAAALRVPPQPAAVVVEHPTTAANLALPIVATWSA
jgi:hypothetical protein